MTTIKLKNGSGAPTAGDLVQGEPALDLTNKRLYTEDSGGTVIEVGTNPGEDVTFADNRKAIFGAGSDLQIYHSGSESRIDENGAGNLKINADNLEIYNSASSEAKAKFNTNGSVQLYYDNAEKLATTSTGIDVTGTVTADGLTVESTGATYFNAAVDAGTGLTTLKSTNNSTGGSLKIQTGGSDRFQISAVGDISFYEDTGTTAKFFWDAADERLGIGTTSPSKKLSIKADGGGSQLGIDIHNEGTATGDDAVISFETQGSREFTMGLDRSATSFVIAESSTLGSNQRLVIDDSGNVGINQTSPTRKLHVTSAGSGVVATFGDSLANNTIEVTRTTTNASYIGLSATSAVGGIIAGPTFAFNTCDSGGGSVTERMRIDSSGNLLVGKTSSALNTAGFEVASSGRTRLTRDSANVVEVNRTTNDGSLVTFSKDGSSVGSIGTKDADLYIGTDDTTLRFVDGSDKIYPADASGNARDAAIDLGNTNARFKDLYLSGGAYLGGTGSANKLDDYEEGTWTPAPTSGTLNAGATGSYVKIGNLVHVQGQLSFSANGTTNRINGLPFRPRIEATLSSIRQRFLVYSNSTTAIYGYCQDVNDALFLQNENRTDHDFDTADGVYTFAFTYET